MLHLFRLKNKFRYLKRCVGLEKKNRFGYIKCHSELKRKNGFGYIERCSGLERNVDLATSNVAVV